MIIDPFFKLRPEVKLAIDKLADQWRQTWPDYTFNVEHTINEFADHHIRFIAGGLVGGTDITYVAWQVSPVVLVENYRTKKLTEFLSGNLARLAATLDELDTIQPTEQEEDGN